MEIVYVDSEASLAVAIQVMSAETTYLAMDTEFRREDTYFPQLCLIQVATKEHIFLIDTIKIKDIAPFFSILTNPDILKVFHSGRQDLEIFCHLMGGDVAAPIFDTQIAAMLAGYGESAGFESLVYKLLKVSMDKSLRHTNWTHRPLTEQQKSYAINDVLYLRPLYEALVQKLHISKRLSWITQEVKSLETASYLIPNPSDVWRKFTLRHPTSKALELLKQLTTWREETAQKTDTPRSWILKDDVILEIADRKSMTLDQLLKVSHFPKDDPLVAEEVFAIVQRVHGMPEDELPHVDSNQTLSKSQQNLLEIVKLLLKVVADDLGLNPKLIAEKDDLIQWIITEPAYRKAPADQEDWRYKMFWQRAEDVLSGKLTLKVQNHKVVCE
jgi:ribonuclease D